MADSPTDFSDRQVLVNGAGKEIKAEAHGEMAVWQAPMNVCSALILLHRSTTVRVTRLSRR
jgi:hypothetical protein